MQTRCELDVHVCAYIYMFVQKIIHNVFARKMYNTVSFKHLYLEGLLCAAKANQERVLNRCNRKLQQKRQNCFTWPLTVCACSKMQKQNGRLGRQHKYDVQLSRKRCRKCPFYSQVNISRWSLESFFWCNIMLSGRISFNRHTYTHTGLRCACVPGLIKRGCHKKEREKIKMV